MNGAEDSFRQYVAARLPSLSRVARLLVGDVHLAEDLVQTALAKAARHWERIVSRGDPDPYVRRILYTEHVSWWRRRRVREVLDTELDQEPVAAAVDVPLRVTLERALARLTPKQRAVLVLRFYEDLTEAQTAELLEVSVGTVKSQTRHALARLRAVAPDLEDLLEVTP